MEITYTLNEIDTVAKKLLENLESKVILFNAPMGAGKTTLIKSICKQLGVVNEVTSPTFSLVNEYKGTFTDVIHFDLYRLETYDQLIDIGIDYYLEKDAFCLIEWPELSISFLSDYQYIKIEILGLDARKLILEKVVK
ncbi:tRNA (adenosine(37)-N6)-threonylcarbamoyltransferase complex ATPase subunit type 1 TsaE [Nonlabens sp. MB-3u-79]|jgi:tRNA threonylcarbamoyladenosine biosynthesis protein TsaE|uniref:tRNA (adenosine(37)-N6)-threonylcarbamoyltransferase complex ATPase subunit type 1 TsaE n=1 Tax=Nonlabens sp. MB-3u-79 TaxID=2058134 RepID=UPI000C30C038|nr:tRNA (adenosine(37)-N6)-threonylcarbamoyltransferase complex ATPase subunit type 1 TsaE [Nonlabens sp. MB-3u-79]AUC79778.1 tRNA (adenosine(37)-N6)-threonylcarbamoyltransferase complex ATPase subunit type 1 TsaE [Nonlabens sp. MB-3u-79]|tara:strand:+ start:46424 stop:46837 length:414 start_codon:yes stop_codon:yes gene_type:complete